ncbi:FRG domain-containing protein [Fictibacillus nanhaiensis]|uniref:FRG domain-containing protein n=1 Tax=Fictibacillus nanhaiensis TaxID=742169 RepID=A0ABS2ZVJ3_9BACL|nr:FRG domain-containing protein [Fictibacillus nanhaiensis]
MTQSKSWLDERKWMGDEMKYFESEIFGKIREPENFYELMELITIEMNQVGCNVKFWRGQGDIRWPIHSGAYRRLENSGNSEIRESDIKNYEKSLLLRASHRGLDFLEGKKLSDFELLARLQHHGAATRLVDFSKNCLIALWFCITSNPDKTGLLIGIHSSFVGGNEGKIWGEIKKDYSSFIGNITNYNHPFVIEPPVVSPRIAAQHAVFLYSEITSESTGSLKIPTGKDKSLFIAISPKLKKIMRQILIESFDIRTETILPDLDGFAISNSYKVNTSDMWRW